jgi:hypothetical protein
MMWASEPLEPEENAMTGRDKTSKKSERSVRDRLTHSARIALVAFQRRDDESAIDREAARRLTVARLHAGAML